MNYNPDMPHCGVCGKRLTWKGRKYCSKRCYGASRTTAVTVKCDRCGRPVSKSQSQIKASDRNYCSRECSSLSQEKRVRTPCANCGEIMERWPSHLETRKSLYCSRECHYRDKGRGGLITPCDNCGKTVRMHPSQLKRKKTEGYYCYNCRGAAISEAKTKPKITLACQFCHTQFDVVSHKKEQRFCSHSCWREYVKQDRTGENSPYYKRVKAPCAICGSPMEVHPYRLSRAEHLSCSKECNAEVISRRVSGSKHPMWNPSLTPEDRRWNRPGMKKWVSSVLQRDNHTCQRCSYQEDLCAHHILSYSAYPDLRTDLGNGISLCAPCHKEFHSTYGTKTHTRADLEEFLSATIQAEKG